MGVVSIFLGTIGNTNFTSYYSWTRKIMIQKSAQFAFGTSSIKLSRKKYHQNITMVQMTGTYTRTEEKDYDKFLSKLGVNFMLRKAATISTPNMEITETGGKWKMVTSTSLKSIVLEFELVIIFLKRFSDSNQSLTRKSFHLCHCNCRHRPLPGHSLGKK